MKKIFTSIMLLLAIAAGTTLVSCNKKNAEKKYTSEEQANKLDATGEAFIAELDLDNWKATADLAIPGIMFLENADMRGTEAPEIVTRENKVDVEKLKWDRTYTIDMTDAKGHYTLDAEGKGAKVAGDFKDLQIAFTAEGHNYVADITFTNSDKTFILSEDESKVDYYYDADENYVYCEGMVRHEKDILKVPATMKANFTVDGKKQFTAEGAMTFNGYESLEEAPVVKNITVDVNLTVTAGDYTLNLSKLSLKGGTFDETFTFKHNKKQLLSVTSKATGLDYIERVGVKSGEEEGDVPFACDNATVAVDVLGQVQVKGNLKFNDFYSKYLTLTDSEPKTVEEANALLKQLEPYYNLNVYYDKGNTVQAYVRPKAYEMEREDGEKRMDIAAVIYFQDGTSQAVTEFFTAENFAKTYAALESFVGKIQDYFEAFQPEADSDLR